MEFRRPGVLAKQYSSEHFVLSAGAIAFSISKDSPIKVCLVHQSKKDEWLLAKGRKDEGEDLATTAVREVLEESGYLCRLLPVTLPTRSTVPSSLAGPNHQPDVVRLAQNCTEPFYITIRPSGDNVKLIFWYIGEIYDMERKDTRDFMEAESFGKSGLFDVEEALQMLTYEDDRELLRCAAGLVTRSMVHSFASCHCDLVLECELDISLVTSPQ